MSPSQYDEDDALGRVFTGEGMCDKASILSTGPVKPVL